MIKVLKKGLMFLFVLIIASVLFNVNANDNSASSASEIIEIIDRGDQPAVDGYVEDTELPKESTNIFVRIIELIANFIKVVVQSIFNIISRLVTGISSFNILY